MAEETPSRFRKRMQARRDDISADGPVLTEEDDANLAAFEANIDATLDLLHEEIAAVEAGHLDRVTELYDRKADLLKRIELKIPVIEPFLEASEHAAPALREKLRQLKVAVQDNSVLLSRMSEATRDIVREIEKIRNRHSLDGLYGKSGKPVTGQDGPQMHIDREF
ncbi:hypothetical protein [Thioclava nitratireducens]|uniref:hypothetical protein n=1 Tax=Thioclava nitratireducens TaxID=1915078 RepID=UPI002481243F|nr:hypothetical protein [Thioclava nitratireducens]WGT51737.1 hypothetical protein P0N61_06855 [Thioclava nitratireducens]